MLEFAHLFMHDAATFVFTLFVISIVVASVVFVWSEFKPIKEKVQKADTPPYKK